MHSLELAPRERFIVGCFSGLVELGAAHIGNRPSGISGHGQGDRLGFFFAASGNVAISHKGIVEPSHIQLKNIGL